MFVSSALAFIGLVVSIFKLKDPSELMKGRMIEEPARVDGDQDDKSM